MKSPCLKCIIRPNCSEDCDEYNSYKIRHKRRREILENIPIYLSAAGFVFSMIMILLKN
jgi:hypothetical protein